MKKMMRQFKRGYYALHNLIKNKEEYEEIMSKDINMEDKTMFSSEKSAAQRAYERIKSLPGGERTHVLLGVIGKDQISYTIKYADDSELAFDRKTMELKAI